MDESSEIVTNDTYPIPPNGSEGEIPSTATPADSEDKENEAQGSKVKDSTQKTEQVEPGVYITFILSEDGTKIFKRVKFRAKEWFATVDKFQMGSKFHYPREWYDGQGSAW
ncbi:hypothetical protein AMTR_s00040p00149460 [Amborella trichopoda]|uniref:BRX domain-containing protein n=1 Tax=Amborella trichopoda TaxID=13333 RepID=W1PXT1_AMBTC|nr:hypothetical protein AMTR_s00040p00149460 [Amborella trichopoda]